MKKILLCGIALVTGLMSCTEDFTDWAAPQSNTGSDPAEVLELNLTPTVSSIDFATYEGETVQLFSTNLSKEQTNKYTVDFSGEDTENTATLLLRICKK